MHAARRVLIDAGDRTLPSASEHWPGPSVRPPTERHCIGRLGTGTTAQCSALPPSSPRSLSLSLSLCRQQRSSLSVLDSSTVGECSAVLPAIIVAVMSLHSSLMEPLHCCKRFRSCAAASDHSYLMLLWSFKVSDYFRFLFVWSALRIINPG